MLPSSAPSAAGQRSFLVPAGSSQGHKVLFFTRAESVSYSSRLMGRTCVSSHHCFIVWGMVLLRSQAARFVAEQTCLLE